MLARHPPQTLHGAPSLIDAPLLSCDWASSLQVVFPPNWESSLLRTSTPLNHPLTSGSFYPVLFSCSVQGDYDSYKGPASERIPSPLLVVEGSNFSCRYDLFLHVLARFAFFFGTRTPPLHSVTGRIPSSPHGSSRDPNALAAKSPPLPAAVFRPSCFFSLTLVD